MTEDTALKLPYAIYEIAGEALYLLPEKAIFWPARKSLLLADLHLGKAGHFRKAGVPVSGKIHEQDLSTLENLIQTWQPEQVIFLGDLFHSSYNQEWDQLEEWLQLHNHIHFILVKGNRDVLTDYTYKNSVLEIKEGNLIISPFLLTHHPPASGTELENLYVLCGHIHPAIHLLGAARQQLTLPCFYFGLHYGILPAFGKFTGFYKIKPKTGDHLFGILPHRVIPLQA